MRFPAPKLGLAMIAEGEYGDVDLDDLPDGSDTSMYAAQALTALFDETKPLPVLPAHASEEQVMEYYAEIAAFQQEALPPAAFSDVHSYGTVVTDKEHTFKAVVCSMHGEQAALVPGRGSLLDSGAKLSCVSEAAVAALSRKGAIAAIDNKALTQAKMLYGFNDITPSARISHAVVLRLTDPENDQFHIVHTFLVVPHLGYALILGRDFLNAHVYKASHDGSGNVTYDFSPNVPRITSIDAPGVDKLPYFTPDNVTKWLVVQREELDTATHHRNYVSTAVQVYEQDATTPVRAPPDQHVEVTFTHPCIRQRHVVTGVSYGKIIIEVNANSGIISKGTIIGTATPMLKHTTAVDPRPTRPARPRVAEIFGGCGSFALGACETTDVKLVANSSGEALSRAQANLPSVRTLLGNLT
jgi:hypothetical protein